MFYRIMMVFTVKRMVIAMAVTLIGGILLTLNGDLARGIQLVLLSVILSIVANMRSRYGDYGAGLGALVRVPGDPELTAGDESKIAVLRTSLGRYGMSRRIGYVVWWGEVPDQTFRVIQRPNDVDLIIEDSGPGALLDITTRTDRKHQEALV